MTPLANLFGRFKTAKPDAEIIARIKIWMVELLDLPEGTTLAVNEIICRDPACPGMETIILVMEPGKKTRAYKINKNMDEVAQTDLIEAISSGGN